jgi:hypothetical protein
MIQQGQNGRRGCLRPEIAGFLSHHWGGFIGSMGGFIGPR